MHLLYSFRSAVRFSAAVLAVNIITIAAPLRAQQATPNPASSNSSSIMIVLDTSNHAKGSIHTLEHAAANLAQQFGSESELALMTAGDKPKLAQDFTGDSALVAQAIAKSSHTGGALALYETLAAAVQQVRGNALNERKAIIAYVSDLERANRMPAGWQDTLRGSPAVAIYLIALRGGNWQTMELAQQVAASSGGAAYAPIKASDLPKVSKSIASRLGATGPDDAKAKADEPLRPLNNYTMLVVREIPVEQTKETSEIGGGENLLLQRILVSRLQKANLFKEVREADSNSEATAAPAAGATEQAGTELEMLPMIVGFRRGSRARRQFAFTTLGGASKMRVQVILRDRATRETVATFVEQGSHSSGLWGGSDEKVQAEAMLAVSNHIVDAIRKMKHQRK